MNRMFQTFIGYLLVLLLAGCFDNGQVELSSKSSGKNTLEETVMTQNFSPVVSAEALLKSKSGRSMTEQNVAITTENVEEFAPTPKTIAEATQGFEKLGFTVSPVGMTLTIQGESALFEKVFGVKLNLERNELTDNVIARPESELIIPESLREVVEQVVFPEPPQFFP